MLLQALAHNDSVSFGPFTLRVSERLLENEGKSIKLGARALDILTVLIEHAGKIVSKTELMARVWSDVTVEEGCLRYHMVALRKALGEGRDGAQYITTLSGRGYCFVAPIFRIDDAQSAAAANSAPDVASPLPARLDHIIGRDGDVEEFSRLLTVKRLLSIVGPGGVGKTTVAIAVGHRIADNFPGDVCFVDCAPETASLPAMIALKLGLPVRSDYTISDLSALLKSRKLLLILDNCEHVVEAAALLAERIVTDTARVHILVTSRVSLRAQSEQVVHMLPLESPPPDPDLTANQILTYPAAQLFVERVRANGGVVEGKSDAQMIAEICRRLDGIALAIEVAASQISAFGIRGTAAMLDDRFGLLWERRRTSVARHQTLAAMLGWSYDRLSGIEAIVFQRLSVFVGLFTLEDAKQVAARDDLSVDEVVVAITMLVAKSLIAAMSDRAHVQYRLLAPMRAYAFSKLTDSGEAEQTLRAHALFFLHYLEKPQLDSPTSNLEFATREVHLGDIRAALKWSFSKSGDLRIGISLAAAAVPLFIQISSLLECRRWTELAIDCLDKDTQGTRSEMDLQAAKALYLSFSGKQDDRARIALLRSLAIAEAHCDLPSQLNLLGRLYLCHTRVADCHATFLLARQSEEVAEKMGVPTAMAAANCLLGMWHHFHQSLTVSRSHLETTIAHASVESRLRDPGLGFDYRNLARVFLARTLWMLGFPERAKAAARRAVDDAASRGHQMTLGISLVWAVSVFLWSGDWPAAEEYIERLIALGLNRPLIRFENAAQGAKGYLLVKRGEIEGGMQLMRSSLEGLHADGYELTATDLEGALAEALLAVGCRDEASARIDAALAAIETDGDGSLTLPELLRIKATIAASGSEAESNQAEQLFSRSLALAKANSALSWQLRTSISLAQFWFKRGRAAEARQLLRTIYEEFTEGFESADLALAQRLLIRLEGVPIRPRPSF